LTYSIW